MRHAMHRTLVGLVAATFGLAPAFAETLSFKADLKGSSEVPPVTTPASGTVTAMYDTASKKLSWKGSVSGLSGNATAAHFHGPAEPGKNAGVLVPVTGVSSGPFEGQATLNEDQAKALTAGQTYFNIHTQANPGGEVRGQVVKAQ
jgi:CHRD domain-containing protein